ncbi:glycerate kinase [Staphylococcus auricularis]|uniref:Glycerate kinase n=1 Tax=Staphylococcus auricularis TaxID=29379 RepID=A0ABX5IIP0_9STAP|nr:glycerate kinase [Staphylococcus auricularis]MCE5038552.1 glycerate kinase [Staphylococcus auricularis]MEB6570205.1 glycerate kinase [Staphylococcus auricularis]PTH19568.1 glycerate kinase [Staphylococcus auricularis]
MKPFNIIIAPDSFKESMTARQAAEAIQRGFEKGFKQPAQYTIIPMADGGEGTTAVLIEALSASLQTVEVKDPLNRSIKAQYGLSTSKQTAVIELAAASGLDLLKESERDPRHTTTFGTGQLILDALNHDVKRIILGLGGSATNDGGVGMLQALGVRFLDAQNKPLPLGGVHLSELATIDTTLMDPRLAEIEITVASDVSNPLLGERGATAVYGPQKGLNAQDFTRLEGALSHYHDIIEQQLHISVKDRPGAGAAGGTGTALLAFLDATLSNGIELVLEETHFVQHVAKADLVITGEGRIDSQTIYGKTPIGVAKSAQPFHCPVIAICGSIGTGYEAVYQHGIDSVFSILNAPTELKDALLSGPQFIETTAENIARLLSLKF